MENLHLPIIISSIVSDMTIEENQTGCSQTSVYKIVSSDSVLYLKCRKAKVR
ncbi:MAG: hypothetical protein GX111_09790 [Clostridiales bacterium]|jgi:aminoglycoside phosphotransferase|nr:hypothetical protein [Clostridiales bacterium]